MRGIHLTVLFAGFIAGTAIACTSSPDPSKDAERALKEASFDDVRVEWDGKTRIAHLQGRVASPADKERAEEIAASAVGTTGRILSEVTIQGLNDETADDLDGDIHDALEDMVDKDAVLKERDIEFSVSNGVVTVKGEVRTAAEKAKVTQLVRAAPGVKDFANALEIEPRAQ